MFRVLEMLVRRLSWLGIGFVDCVPDHLRRLLITVNSGFDGLDTLSGTQVIRQCGGETEYGGGHETDEKPRKCAHFDVLSFHHSGMRQGLRNLEKGSPWRRPDSSLEWRERKFDLPLDRHAGVHVSSATGEKGSPPCLRAGQVTCLAGNVEFWAAPKKTLLHIVKLVVLLSIGSRWHKF